MKRRPVKISIRWLEIHKTPFLTAVRTRAIDSACKGDKLYYKQTLLYYKLGWFLHPSPVEAVIQTSGYLYYKLIEHTKRGLSGRYNG